MKPRRPKSRQPEPKPPSQEYFDVVDSRDQVVGRASRPEVHAKGLWHRAVHVLVDDGRGKWFLQKRSRWKDLSAGLWDAACSGHVDSGEDYDAAVRRELDEELGLKLMEPWAALKLGACDETGWEFIWVYRLTHPGPFELNPLEIEEGAWVAAADLERRMADHPEGFTRCFRRVWSEFVRASDYGAFRRGTDACP